MNDEVLKYEDELEKLKKTLPENIRSVFLDYCKEKIQLKEQGSISMRDASNRMCGVCSLFFEEVLPEFEEVMDIACDLELPDDVRERPIDDWEKLTKLIRDKK